MAAIAVATIRCVRLVSGLTLFTFVLHHLLIHAFGLGSLDSPDRAEPYFFTIWTICSPSKYWRGGTKTAGIVSVLVDVARNQIV